MKQIATILSITGSDSTGRSGIQSDIKTIRDLGCFGATAVTSITIQNSFGIQTIHELSTELVAGQIKSVYGDTLPDAVKVGMINNPDTIRAIKDEIIGCRNIVCSPGILSSHGGCLMSNDSLHALRRMIIPISRLLMLKCIDAEILLGKEIKTDDDMRDAAQQLCEMGAQWVLLRGGLHTQGRINALLYGKDYAEFFSSYNIEGWRKHGVGGALSTAVATRLALGDDMPVAIKNAHAYIHSQIVYSVDNTSNTSLRYNELYNELLSLIADNYRNAHDVLFYAERMSITPRYLSQITRAVIGKTPKRIIDDYLLEQIETLLSTTSKPIQEIAHTLGFSSQIMLAKFFKQKKGCSPTEFRNGARK